MPATAVSQLLRADLLAGVRLVLVGTEATVATAEQLGGEISAGCAALGARVWLWEARPERSAVPEERLMDEAVEGAIADMGGVEAMVVDGAALFAAAAQGAGDEAARTALRGCLAEAWNATRAVVHHALLPAQRGGRIIYVAPADTGAHAQAARAGLENLARTLSVEWARHAITTVAIAPGPRTTAAELAALVAYLASPAGAYFSGCVLQLGAAAGAAAA